METIGTPGKHPRALFEVPEEILSCKLLIYISFAMDCVLHESMVIIGAQITIV
jgi:hypothetical protein